MRVLAVSSANKFSFSGQRKNRVEQSHPPITYNEKAIRVALLCLTAASVGTILYTSIKDPGNNSIKSAYNNVKTTVKDCLPDPMKHAVGKKRDITAVNKYKAYRAKEKLVKLQTRIDDGEFANKPKEVIEDIKKQFAKLTRNASKVN